MGDRPGGRRLPGRGDLAGGDGRQAAPPLPARRLRRLPLARRSVGADGAGQMAGGGGGGGGGVDRPVSGDGLPLRAGVPERRGGGVLRHPPRSSVPHLCLGGGGGGGAGRRISLVAAGSGDARVAAFPLHRRLDGGARGRVGDRPDPGDARRGAQAGRRRGSGAQGGRPASRARPGAPRRARPPHIADQRAGQRRPPSPRRAARPGPSCPGRHQGSQQGVPRRVAHRARPPPPR